MSALLRFERVALVRGGRLLFENLDLVLGSGEALHVAGPNGTGKSSLIRLAAGLLEAAAGNIQRPERIALADEKPALDRELPLGKALKFWIDDPLPGLAAMAIEDLADVPVRFLSSGQLKRAGLARAVASSARLWLLDEPLNALDDEAALRLSEAIADHRRSGGAVIAASHSPLPGDWTRMRLGQ